VGGDNVYVYGVSSGTADALPKVNGVEDARLDAVEHEGLVALTSRLNRGRLLARDLRAHWRVLEQAFEQTTVLPVRFGTVMESEEAVRAELLEPNAGRLSSLLEEMSGLIQLNLKGQYDEDALLREIVHENGAIGRLRDQLAGLPPGSAPREQLRLGQAVEAEVVRHRARDTELALAALDTAALASRAEDVAHPAAFDLAFLVERSAEQRFGKAVHSLREKFGSRIGLRYIGPLPPFSFADANLSSGGGAWG
jgi:hypothetical protein